MMTDRDLLKLAAKAAGVDARWSPDGLLRDCTDGHPAMNIYAAPTWNPLTDDGDALRLAVKLRLPMSFASTDCWGADEPATHVSKKHIDSEWVPFREPHNGNPCAATRRAIVRAAAEIGRNMK